LLLDVGVETLLRLFLAKSNIKTKSDRLNFHELIDDVKQIAGTKIDENDLEDAKRFHNFRNKIYRQGDGFFPGTERFDGYLKLANNLLTTLLNSDEQPEDLPIEYTFETLEKLGKELILEVNMSRMADEFKEFQLNLAVAAEVFNPRYASKRLEARLKELLTNADIDADLFDGFSEKNQKELDKVEIFTKLTGIKTNDIDFIDKIISDVTYLYLYSLLEHKVSESEDVKRYSGYRRFVEKFSGDYKKTTSEDKEEFNQILSWTKSVISKLRALYDKD